MLLQILCRYKVWVATKFLSHQGLSRYNFSVATKLVPLKSLWRCKGCVHSPYKSCVVTSTKFVTLQSWCYYKCFCHFKRSRFELTQLLYRYKACATKKFVALQRLCPYKSCAPTKVVSLQKWCRYKYKVCDAIKFVLLQRLCHNMSCLLHSPFLFFRSASLIFLQWCLFVVLQSLWRYMKFLSLWRYKNPLNL